MIAEVDTEFPKTPSGKVQRQKARALYESGELRPAGQNSSLENWMELGLEELTTTPHERDETSDPEGPTSQVVERRAHQGGELVLERRSHVRKDGSKGWCGPYWYFHSREGSKQKTTYLGKTDDPEAKLAETPRARAPSKAYKTRNPPSDYGPFARSGASPSASSQKPPASPQA